MRTDLENVNQNPSKFMQVCQARIDNAMEHYTAAVAEKFTETNDALEKVKENLHAEVQDMFSAQSQENGSLWQNLVGACNQNFAATLKAYMGKVVTQLDQRAEARTSHVSAVWQEKLVESAENLKTCFGEGLDSLTSRMEKIEMRTMTPSAAQTQQDLTAFFEQKMQAMDCKVDACFQVLHELAQKSANSGNLAEVEGVQATHAPPRVIHPCVNPMTYPNVSASSTQPWQSLRGVSGPLPHPHILEFESSEIGEGGGLPVPLMAQQALFEFLDDFAPPPAFREVQVRPVGVGGGGNSDDMSFANFPIAQHLSKATPPPSFSNRKEDWPHFLRKYDLWVRNLSGGRALSDSQQLQLLNSCLPEILQKEMQLLEREKGRKLTFVEFFAHLEAKCGRAHSESMRKRWLEYKCPKVMENIQCKLLMNFA